MPNRHERLRTPALQNAMRALEDVFADAAEHRISETLAAAVDRAQRKGHPLDQDALVKTAREIRAEHEARRDTDLDAILDLLRGTMVEHKARDQEAFDLAQANKPCEVCFAPPAGSRAPGAGGHAMLPHLVHDERSADGYVPCGCRDGENGPCVRAAGHVGVCAQAYDANPSFLSPPVGSFVCRVDDSEPHPA